MSSSPQHDYLEPNLPSQSRIHKLPSQEADGFWIKREDELSSGISGSKLRKYASLIPYLLENRVDLVGMIGGPNSNNLVGLAQILRENRIKPIAFVRDAADPQLRGNALLLRMLLDKEEIVSVPRDKWSSVQDFAKRYLLEKESSGQRTHLLDEGCFGFEALPGAMTLAKDILRNEKESALTFSRIYIDSGTGLGAIGLILALELEPRDYSREIVITLIADDEQRFLEKLSQLRAQYAKASGEEITPRLHIRFLKPTLCPKFGSINQSLISECTTIARDLGLIMDPTYSVKHYISARKDLRENPNPGSSLFVFNGSALGIMGFQEKLADKFLI